ncbi:hypothetical protein FACS1894179_11100 [Bacteroidia bacterium]|nr:hypothetical protein FACS1894179_11100 [Bacteroidia bacterium]
MTDAEVSAEEVADPDFKLHLAGLMVYNLTDNGTSFFPGIFFWDGSQWMGVTPNKVAFEMSVTAQPAPFSFCETGVAPTDIVPKLTFDVNPALDINGVTLATTYQWYQVTGNNAHVRIGAPVGQAGTIYTSTATANAAGANTAAFTPQAVLKGTTRNAGNAGFYRFYCVATDANGRTITSDIAEVAVGCGAKNNAGEWLSFMCFNLGAKELTIAAQKNHTMTFSPANDADGKHYYITGEENLYGDLYQWGRIGDGHEKRGAAQGFTAGANTAGTNQVAYNIATPPTYEDGNLIGTSQRYPWRQVARSTTHYGMFITTGAAQNYNWAYNLPANQIDLLWRNARFAPNDPCAKINADGVTYQTWYPVQNGTSGASTGWRTPSQNEWGSLYKGGTISGSSSVATANTWVWNGTNGRGFEIKPDGKTTTLFLPAGGYRGGGTGLLFHQGGAGDYWSTDIIGTSAYGLNFNSSSVNPALSYPRSNGFALRCIKNS